MKTIQSKTIREIYQGWCDRRKQIAKNLLQEKKTKTFAITKKTLSQISKFFNDDKIEFAHTLGDILYDWSGTSSIFKKEDEITLSSYYKDWRRFEKNVDNYQKYEMIINEFLKITKDLKLVIRLRR